MTRALLLFGILAAALLLVWLLGVVGPGTAIWITREEAIAPKSGPDVVHGTDGERRLEEAPETTLVGRAVDRVPEAHVPPHFRGPLIEIHGLVVDEQRRPMAGTHVFATGGSGQTSSTRTGPDGRYRVPWHSLFDGMDIVLIARTPDGRVARGSVWVWPTVRGKWRADPLVLRDGHRLAVRVARKDERVPAARVGVYALVKRQSGADLALVAEARTNDEGDTTFEQLAAGPYTVIVTTTEGGRARRPVTVPTSSEAPIPIELGATHTVRFRVLEEGTEKPLEGVRAELLERPDDENVSIVRYRPELAIPRSDAAGRMKIGPIAGTSDVTLFFQKAGYQTAQRALPLGEEEVERRVNLVKAAGGRWRLVDGESPAPADGEEIRIRALLQTAEGPLAAERGRVVGDLLDVAWLTDHGSTYVAEAPDGSMALLPPDGSAEEPKTVAFAPPRTLDVYVRWPSGAPAENVLITIRTAGDYPSARSTDARGHAQFSGLAAALYDVQSVGARLPSETVDLQEGNGRHERVLGPEHLIRLQVFLDGVPGLPPRYEVHQPDILLRQEDDPTAGTITLHVRPRATGEGLERRAPNLDLVVAGYMSSTSFDPLVDGEPITGTVRLRRSGIVKAEVRGPSVADDLSLQRWDPDKRVWKFATSGRPDDERQATARGRPVVFHPLVDGLHRIVDWRFGCFGPEVEVRADEGPQTLVADFSSAGLVYGRIVGPPGCGFDEAYVQLEDLSASEVDAWEPDAVEVEDDGTFEVPVPGTRRVRLRAWHPELRSSASGGEAIVVAPQRGVVLHMEEGAVALFRFEPALEGNVLVWVETGSEGKRLQTSHRIPADVQPLRLGGLLPGPTTFWIDAPGFAPFRLPSTNIEDGGNDLGTVTLQRGSTLTVELPREADPDVGVSATVWHLGTPRYERSASGAAGGRLEIQGLGAGRFRVWVRRWDTDAVLVDTHVEADGTNPVTVRVP